MKNGRLRKKETITGRPSPTQRGAKHRSQATAREKEAFVILFCNRERI